MLAEDIRKKLDQAISLDRSQDLVYLNIQVLDEKMSIVAFDTMDEAVAQKELLIDSIVKVLT